MTENFDIDDFLNDDSDTTTTPEPTEAPKPVRRTKKAAVVDAVDAPVVPEKKILSADEARIQELEAKLAALENTPDEDEPAELTAAQKRIAELEAQLAVAEVVKAPTQFEKAGNTGETILIHFVEDGFTAQGRIWYRGQELEFAVDGEAYEQTLNRNGESWLDLDVDQQWTRYGKEMFRHGPWRGKGWADGNPNVAAADLAKAASAERARNRAVPLINF